MNHPSQSGRVNLLLRKIYPAFSDNRGSMLPDELEKHLQKLSAHYMLNYAVELDSKQKDIILAQLVEYAVDQLHQTEKFSKRVYEWIDDNDHWIWKIAQRVYDKVDETFYDAAIRRIENLVGSDNQDK